MTATAATLHWCSSSANKITVVCINQQLTTSCSLNNLTRIKLIFMTLRYKDFKGFKNNSILYQATANGSIGTTATEMASVGLKVKTRHTIFFTLF